MLEPMTDVVATIHPNAAAASAISVETGQVDETVAKIDVSPKQTELQLEKKSLATETADPALVLPSEVPAPPSATSL